MGCSAPLFLSEGGCTGFGDVAEDLHDGAEAVAVGHHQHSLPLFYARDDGIVPVGKHSIDGRLQAFGPRKLLRFQVAISLVVAGMARVAGLELGRRNIVAPSPDLHLVLPVFLHCFQLVEALQRAVVPLVEPPILDDRDVVAIEFLSRIVEGLNGPREDRGVAEIELIAVLVQSLARLNGLLNA